MHHLPQHNKKNNRRPTKHTKTINNKKSITALPYHRYYLIVNSSTKIISTPQQLLIRIIEVRSIIEPYHLSVRCHYYYDYFLHHLIVGDDDPATSYDAIPFGSPFAIITTTPPSSYQPPPTLSNYNTDQRTAIAIPNTQTTTSPKKQQPTQASKLQANNYSITPLAATQPPLIHSNPNIPNCTINE